MKKRPARFLLAVAGLTLMVSAAVLANNPIAVNDSGKATRWGAFPISYRVDSGNLGALSNAEANALTAQAFGAWSGVTTANVSAAQNGGPGLPDGNDGDVTDLTDFNAVGCVGVNPIIYDTNGTLTDALLGAGASNNVLGFAGPCAIQPAAGGSGDPDIIVGGRAVMSGKLITSNVGLALSRSKGVFIHELGHFLGLGHSQVNLNCLTNQPSCPSDTPGGDLFGVPSMFPILLNQTETADVSFMETLTVDDNSAISTLYPNPNNSFSLNLGTISGSVFFSDQINRAQGINVIARRVGDPRVTAISNVSGAFARANDGNASLGLPGNGPGSNSDSARGEFTIPGLPPGTYTLEIESVNTSFIGGSSVGPLSRSNGRGENIPIPSPAVPECFGGPESSIDNPAICENLVIAGGTELTNRDIILNDNFSTLDAFDAVSRNEGISTATNITTNTYSNLSISADQNNNDDLDYYALSVTNGQDVSIEIRSRRLNPVRYLDSVIELVDATGTRLLTCRIGDAIAGAFDQPCVNDDYTPTGGSLTRDSKLQFRPSVAGVIFLIVSDRYGDDRPDFIYDLVVGGVAPVPTIAFTPAAHDFGAQTVGNPGFPQPIQVTNTSGATVNLTGFTIIGSNPGDFAFQASIQNPNCNTGVADVTVLAANTSCYFDLTFTPAATGARSATIRVTHNAAGSPADLSVSGTGSGAPPNDNIANAIETFPHPFADFQNTTLATTEGTDFSLNPGGGSTCTVNPANNKSIWYRFRLPNDLAATAKVQLLAFYNAAIAFGVDNDLGPGISLTQFGCFAIPNGTFSTTTLGLPSGGQGFDIYMMVAATGGDGGFAQFSFTYTPDGVTADLSLSVTDNNVVFTEGTNGTYTVMVSNAAGGTATASDPPIQVRDFLPTGFSYVSGGGNGWSCSAALSVVTCSFGANTIAAGANSQFTITVQPNAPAAANSPVTNNVQVFGGGDATPPIPFPPLFTPSNNTNSDTTFVNPAPAPVVDIAPPSKDFGSVGAGTTSATQTFTLLNSGNGTLNVASITKGGTDAAEFNLITAPTGGFTCLAGANILAASASCTFGANFAPTGAGTTKSANISVASNASTSPNLVALSGTTVPLGTLTGSATSFNFGSIVVGQSSATQTFTLSNPGPGDLTVSALDVTGNAANSDDFMPSPATTCPVDTDPFVPFPLASGGSCDIVLAFTPTALGLRDLTATFTATNSTVASVAVTLSGTGLAGAATAILTTSSTTAVQSTAINTAFPTPLQARVTDASGFPVAGVLVTFTAPGAGATGTFAGGVNTATTDAGGVATAAAFTANGITGNYAVSASAGAVGPVTFNMNNLANTPSIQTIAGGGSGAAPSICADSQFGGIFGGFYYFKSCNQVFKAPVGGGAWTLVAGTGAIGYSGDEGLAINATLGNGLGQIFVDAAGNVFIADAANNRIRRVDAATGIIQTIAGFGTAPTLPAPNDDGTPAVLTQLSGPRGVFVDGGGTVFIADTGTGRVRKIVNGQIQTVAGNGSQGFSGDNNPATSAQLDSPLSVYVDGAGNVFVVDSGNGLIRKVDTGGTITTFAGGAATVIDGVVPTATRLDPQGVWVDGSGNVYITDISFHLVRKVSGGLINSIAGSGSAGYSGDGGPAIAARTFVPLDVYVDGSGNVFFSSHNGIRRIDGGTGIISTVVGNSAYGFSGDGGAATSAQMYEPSGVARDQFGNIYIADAFNYVIRKVNGLTGIVTTVAGNGTPGFSGDGGSATAAQIQPYSGVAVDASGNIFFIDRPFTSVPTSCRVREVVAATGNIQTVAGNGVCTGGATDGVAATATALQSPNAVATDAAGNLFIAQSSRVRVVNMQAGQITVNNVTVDPGQIATVAGTTTGFSGDGLQATAAQLRNPLGLTIDSAGSLFIADSGNARIRKVDTAGVISTVAGTGISGYNGDGIPATSANISAGGVALDAAGNIFIVDRAGARIREVLAASGQITTVAFNGLRSFSGDGGPAVNATSNIPVALALDAATNLLIADNLNARIRYAGVTNPTPTITQLVPSTRSGGVAFLMTVNGMNFVPNSFVTFNGTPKATTYVSDTQVTAQISAADVASQGTVQVTVSNPIPGGGTSANTTFDVTGVVNTFTNGGGDSLWTNDNNWDLAHKPTSTETALIPTGFNVTLDTGAQTITSMDVQGTSSLTISGGSLIFSSASTATNLATNGGTLTATGGLTVSTALNVTAGTATLGASSSATDVTINGGTLTANAALAISGALNLSPGGTLNGTGNVTINSPLTWTGGTMSGTGSFSNNGSANITGGTLDGKTFNNAGAANAHVSNLTMSNGAIFENTFPGAINADTDGTGFIQGAGATSVINNRGTFIRFTATGNYVIDGVQFNNYRTVIMQTDALHVINGPAGQFTNFGPSGIATVNSGDIVVDSPLQLQGGTFGGTHTLFGGLDNLVGIARPGNATTGVLTIDTSYTQGPFGTMNIELGGTTVGTQYDQLNVTGAPGTAAVDGTLNVTLINGFPPVLGDSFTIVQSAGALTGTFASENLPPLNPGLSWRVTYNPNSVVLDVVTATLTLSPDPLDFGNQKVLTTSSAQTVTVTNTGGAAATLAAATAVALSGTDAADFAITGGTCANNTVLAAAPGPGNTCTINLTFTPGALGGRAATITVTSNASNNPTSSALSGTGVLANVTVTPNPVDFGSIALTTTSAASTITVTNTGTLAATLAAANPVTITGAQAVDFGIVGGTTTCVANFVLAAGGGSCVVNVTFTPGALGAHNATVNVFDDAPGSPQQTALTGTGVQSAITLNPSPVNFGNQRVLTTSGAMTVTVTNTGTLAATLDAANSVTIIGANAGDFAIVGGTTTCVDNFPLAANGGSCIVDITFTPSVTGALTATLSIADDDPNSPQQAVLNGTGVLANVTLAPDPLDFGDKRQGVTSAAQTITVTNTGNENATLTAGTPVTITGAQAGDFAIVGGTTTCVANFVLNASGGSCVINITFTPGALGARTATVNVADDAPGSPQQATLNGTGVLANVTLAPDPVDFGNQKVLTTSGAMTITATNTGTEAATLAAANVVTFTGANAADFTVVAGTTCLANVVIAPGGGSCVINVTFRPGATGARTATVNLVDDAPGSPQQATLNGTGVQANVTVTPNPVDFGSIALTTTSAPMTVTVTNSGTLDATLQGFGNPLNITGANPGDFAIVAGTTTCVAGFVLTAGGGSCVINVTFSPTALGARTATLGVFDPPDAPQQTALTGTGVQSLITLNPSPVNFGDQKVLTTSAAMTVTVTNTGTLAATLDAANSVTIIGANAGDFAIVGGTTTCVDNFVLAENGGFCIVDITFTPSVTGARTATLNIADSDPNSPQQATLNGTGVLANITVAPNPVAFAARIIGTTSAAMTATVTNTGTLAATLAVNPVTITGTDPGDFAVVGGTTTCVANFVLAAGGGSCVVDVTFTPGASGARAATLNVFDDAPASPQQTALTGAGQIAPTADFSATNINFPDTRVGQSTAATTVTVTNSGEFPLEIVSLSLTGVDPSQFVLTNSGAGSCSPLPNSVPGGGNCTFTVAFAPTSLLPAAAKSANVSVSHNGNATGTPGTVTDVALTGTAIQANITLTANPTAFGNQRVGTASAAMTVTVTNSGTDVATLAAANAVTITGANAADFANAGTGTCVNGLALAISPGPGNTCTIDIVFTPSATGARAATVNVADDAPGSPQTAALTGTGIQANITLAPNPGDFGNVKVGTPSAPLTVTVTNSGTDVATLAGANAVTITGTNAAEFVNDGTGTCVNGLVLAVSPGPGNTCTVNVVFTPAALGARGPVTLNIADDAPGSPHTATLNGTGVLANLTLAPSPLNFGGINLGSNVTMSFTVTNTGTLAATLGAGTPVTISGADVGDFSVVANTTCVASFVLNAGGGSCIINVRFTPTALGARAAQVDVASDAPGNPHVVLLSGTGTQPGFNLSSTSVTTWPTVAEIQVGMTGTAAAITVSNPAGVNAGPLTINSISDDSGNFSFVSNCPLAPATLAAGGSCTITPSLSPQAGSVGPLAASISIVHDAGSPGVISLTGTGVDFALITSAAPAMVTAGGSANYTLNFDTAGGDSLFPTTFACSGLPRKAECIFNPSMIPAGSADTTVTLTITTTSNTVTVSSAGVVPPVMPTSGGLPPGGWLAIEMGVLGLFTLATARRQALRLSAARLCLLGLLLVAGGYAAGCAGDGSGVPEGPSGTPPGSYAVAVTATSGTVQRTTNVTLNVQ